MVLLNGEVSSFTVCTPALIWLTHIITTLMDVVGAFWYELTLAIPYRAISEILRLLKASLKQAAILLIVFQHSE